LEEAISLTKRNTIPRINVAFTEIELYIDMKDYISAVNIYKEVVESPIYNSIPVEQKMKWNLLYKRIIEESKG